ncbi:MAG: hypothetical protein RL095_120 [Verrucomicrobiota bacterium]|jgi:hypothetical protein
MSAFLFNIACPRCETRIAIHLGRQSTHCPRCEFLVRISDPDGLLSDFKANGLADLEFHEESIQEKSPDGIRIDGLRLVFSRSAGGASAPQVPRAEPEPESMTEREDAPEHKTAHTQAIHLTFDPSVYMKQIEEQSRGGKLRHPTQAKIPLHKVIHASKTAKPPPPSHLRIWISATLVTLIFVVIIIVIALR